MHRDPQFPTTKQRELEKLCRDEGIPLTVQRRVIMETLAARTDHPTADQIYDQVKQRLNGVSRTTVYRVLETFVRCGVAQKISNVEAKARFDADTALHHHVQCLQCGSVADLFADPLNNLPLPDLSESGFQITGYSVSVTGVCARCRTRTQN